MRNRDNEKLTLRGFASFFAFFHPRFTALLRIFTGALLAADILIYRFGDFRHYYGGNGIFSITDYPAGLRGASFSLLTYLDSEAAVKIFLFLGLGLSIAFAAGIRPRITGLILWYVFYCILYENVYLAFGFDYYLIHLLFLSLFLPLSEEWSLWKDTRRNFFSSEFAAVTIKLQIALVYACTFLAKYGESWWQGYAVRLLLSDPVLAKPAAGFLLSLPGFTTIATWLTLVLEAGIPVLIVISFFRPQISKWVFAAILMLHLPIEIGVDVGLFSWVSIAAGVIFLGRSSGGGSAVRAHPAGKTLQWMVMILMLAGSLRFIISESVVSKTGILPRISSSVLPDKFSILNQEWTMFAPNPPKDLGWVTLEYRGSDGSLRDLFTGEKAEGNRSWKPAGVNRLVSFYLRYWEKKPAMAYFAALWMDMHVSEFLKTHALPDAENSVLFTVYRREAKAEGKEFSQTLIRLTQRQLIQVSRGFRIKSL